MIEFTNLEINECVRLAVPPISGLIAFLFAPRFYDMRISSASNGISRDPAIRQRAHGKYYEHITQNRQRTACELICLTCG